MNAPRSAEREVARKALEYECEAFLERLMPAHYKSQIQATADFLECHAEARELAVMEAMAHLTCEQWRPHVAHNCQHGPDCPAAPIWAEIEERKKP